MANKFVESRKSEIRYITDQPSRMLNKYLAETLVRKWTEEFIDEDTGKIQSIERSEIILERGTLLDQDKIATIRFYMQEGSVKQVEVSNQKRMAWAVRNSRMYLYKARVTIGKRLSTFILYAQSVQNALIILTDFIELNFKSHFCIDSVAEFDSCIVLTDTLKTRRKVAAEADVAYLKGEISSDEYINSQDGIDISDADEENDPEKMKFYQIRARITLTDQDGTDEFNSNYIIHSYSATRANMLIEKYLKDEQEKRYQEWQTKKKEGRAADSSFDMQEIHSFIEESKIIPVKCYVPVEFSEVYEGENSPITVNSTL